MQVKAMLDILGTEFYAGVPDSLLKPLCNYLMATYGIGDKHIIAANEGNAVALAAGYHMATGKIPCVYMQNSGEGNIINPVASLINDKVYAIPVIFIVGWRGEPGVHDEPQHIYQGQVTVKLLEDMDITVQVVDKNTTESQLRDTMERFSPLLARGKSVAFVIRKGALSADTIKIAYKNKNTMLREEIIRHIMEASKEDIVVSTTGKASRELFELREHNGQSHATDFLTVGSMGHSSSIALGIALSKPESRVWCIDGDGAVLMHMGSMALVAANHPHNLVHIVINNSAHETVGGMPTVAGNIDLVQIAKGCGYRNAICVDSFEYLDNALKQAKNIKGPTMIEIKAAIGSREDLGRPTTTALENKQEFMRYLAEKQ